MKTNNTRSKTIRVCAYIMYSSLIATIMHNSTPTREYNANSINNPNGVYGSPYSSKSATNPYATEAPELRDSAGNSRGRLSSNPYDADSTSNPYGRYGSEYSSESVNNPYGAGSPYRSDSPNNPYGEGLEIYGE